MLRTISIGNYIFVQGVFEGAAMDGDIMVRVGSRVYQGKPVGC